MAILIAVPILGFLVVLESSIFSRVPLILGTPDLVLLTILAWSLQKRVETAWQWCIIGGLMVGFVSALPLAAVMAGYALATGLALALRRRVWQVPILAMFVVTFLGTAITHSVSLLALRLAGNPIPIQESVNLITLPSILLNLLLAVPIFALIGDLANWLYPEELEV
jgi:rod shape-determining protein MreD